MPCFTAKEGDCFTVAQQCNGLLDGCPTDGADEWGCKANHEFQCLQASFFNHFVIFKIYCQICWEEIRLHI